MASRCRLDYRINVLDAQGYHIEQAQRVDFAPGVTPNGQRSPLTVTASSFTTITVPSGAVAMAIVLNGATGLTLKGISGDTGVALTPSTNALTGLDLFMPLGANPSVGLASTATSNQVVELIFL